MNIYIRKNTGCYTLLHIPNPLYVTLIADISDIAVPPPPPLTGPKQVTVNIPPTTDTLEQTDDPTL